MPLRPPANGVLKHQIMTRINGQTAVTTIWTHREATADWDVRVADERTILKNWIENNWKGITNTASQTDLLKTWRMDVAPPEKFLDEAYTRVGTSAGAGATIMPGQLAVAVSLRTEPVGAGIRGRNGRIYHGGMTATMFGSGTGDASALHVSNVLTAYNALRTTMLEGAGATAQGTWCIVSYQDGGSRAAPNFRPVPIVLYVDHLLVNTRVDVQRRRAARQNSYTLGT